MYAGSCTVATSSSLGHRGGDRREARAARPSESTPSSRASSTVRSTRIGDIGWVGPKS